jgi:hypothetical protein
MKFDILPHEGKVVGLYYTRDRTDFLTDSVDHLEFDFEGIDGDRHSGYLKPVGPREKHYTKGHQIRNNRQWSAVSVEDNDVIGNKLGLETLKPEWIGANILVEGIPNFSDLPPMTHLRINSSREDAVTLIVFEKNQPCFKPDRPIKQFGGAIPRMPFATAAYNIRGLLGWVDHPGTVRVGDPVQVMLLKG